MNYSDHFNFDADNFALFEGPVKELTGDALTNTPPVTSAKGRLFHDAKDSYLTLAGAIPDTVLQISDARQYTIGDRVLVWMDDNTWHDAGAITAINELGPSITITNSLPSQAAKDTRVCVALGEAIGGGTPWEIDMVYFEPASGAVAGNFNYGWYTPIPDDQVGFEIGIVCRVEMVLDASAGLKGSLILRRPIVGGV